MPRNPRLIYQDAFYHIYNRGLHKENIFKEKADYVRFMDRLSELVEMGGWKIYAYCLMPNHYHFLIEEGGRTPIVKLMSRLLTSHCVYFNRKYERNGPLFQDRYKSKIVQKEGYFWWVSSYIHLNPVKAGLVSDPLDYQFSSLGEYVGKSPWSIVNQRGIEKLLGEDMEKLSEYLDFVKSNMSKDLEEYNPFKNKREIVGSDVFITNRKTENRRFFD